MCFGLDLRMTRAMSWRVSLRTDPISSCLASSAVIAEMRSSFLLLLLQVFQVALTFVEVLLAFLEIAVAAFDLFHTPIQGILSVLQALPPVVAGPYAFRWFRDRIPRASRTDSSLAFFDLLTLLG